MMTDDELRMDVGRMIGRHERDMDLFYRAGLLPTECDSTLASLSSVLLRLADRLRAGDSVSVPYDFPRVAP